MNLSYLSKSEGGNSLVATLRSYLTRYQLTLYVLFAAATSLSVAWNWNWLTGGRGISHHGSTAVHVHDADVHEARRLQVVIVLMVAAAG